jgi:hypothetical protein
MTWSSQSAESTCVNCTAILHTWVHKSEIFHADMRAHTTHTHNNTVNYLCAAAFHCCILTSIPTAHDHRALSTSGHEWKGFNRISSVYGAKLPSYFSGANDRLSPVVIKRLQLDLHTTAWLAQQFIHSATCSTWARHRTNAYEITLLSVCVYPPY